MPMGHSKMTFLVVSAVLICGPGPLFAQAGGGLPDVVGIYAGMSAQDAYKVLSSRANGAKVGVAQTMLQGIDKPVAVLMSLQVLGSSPREEITVYLTYPPQKQVVWGVRRTLTFDQGKELTTASILEGLRQKYGPEINANGSIFWSYDEQGQRSNTSQVVTNNCMGRTALSAPQDFTAPQPITPLPYLQPLPNCGSYMTVRTEFGNGGRTGALVPYLTVIMEDTPLAIRSRQAWHALVAGDSAAARKQEIDKANRERVRRVSEPAPAPRSPVAPRGGSAQPPAEKPAPPSPSLTRRAAGVSAASSNSMQRRADRVMDALDLLDQAERVGLPHKRARRLRDALTEPAASVVTVERVERMIRAWTAARHATHLRL